MSHTIEGEIRSGQKLWFVPVSDVYGPPREIVVYQTGAIWAYFKDKFYQGRIALQSYELEHREGKVYQSSESWQKSGDGLPEVNNQKHLRGMRASLPLTELRDKRDVFGPVKFATYGALAGGLVAAIATQLIIPSNFWKDLGIADQTQNIFIVMILGGSANFAWGHKKEFRPSEEDQSTKKE